MFMHIRDDCNLFINNSTVEKIKKDLVSYQNRVEELQESILSFIEGSEDEGYKSSSAEFYEKALTLHKEVLESPMVELYSKEYIRYHLGDLSNISIEVDKISSQLTKGGPSGSNCSFNNTSSKNNLEAIIKEKDLEIAQYKKKIDELIIKIKAQSQKKRIVFLK